MGGKDSVDFQIQGEILVSGISMNVEVHVIKITEDKLRNILLENQGEMSKKNEWVTPVGIFLTLLIAILTTEAKTAFGLSSDSWQAIFIVCAGLCVIWFFRTVKRARGGLCVDDLISRIKNL